MKKSLIFLFPLLLFLNNCYSDVGDAIKYNEMGNASFAKGEYSQAIIDYNRSLEVDPDYVISFCNRGSAFYNLRQFSQAIKDFDKVIELDPNFHSGIAYVFRASSYFYLSKFPEAIKDYSSALLANPSDARIYNDRANAYYLMDNYELAKKDYKKAYELNPHSKAGKLARQKLNLIKKQIKHSVKSNKELLKEIDILKNSWANELDNAGNAIAEKKYSTAKINIEKSIDLALQLKKELSKNKLSVEKADAMEKLSLTYRNLNSLFEILDNSPSQLNLISLKKLISDSYSYLDKAQPNFKDAPFIEKICQEIRKGLDGISLEISHLE